MDKKYKILLIEDEVGLVLSLTDRLESEGYEVESAADGIKGEERGLAGNYDLVLLDIMLPGKDGFQICKKIREAGLTQPVLMLTARNTTIDTILGLQIGADDYLPKPFDMEVLMARIAALLRRRTEWNSENRKNNGDRIMEFGDFILDTQKQGLFKQGEQIVMNAQEYRLLTFLASHPGRVLSRNELLDEVWGYDSVLTTRTVDVHIAWIRQKLGEKDIPKHIRTIRGLGYKFMKGDNSG